MAEKKIPSTAFLRVSPMWWSTCIHVEKTSERLFTRKGARASLLYSCLLPGPTNRLLIPQPHPGLTASTLERGRGKGCAGRWLMLFVDVIGYSRENAVNSPLLFYFPPASVDQTWLERCTRSRLFHLEPYIKHPRSCMW